VCCFVSLVDGSCQSVFLGEVSFGGGLQKEALSNIEALTRARMGAGTCFEISVYAGITEASSSEDIERIIEKARANLGIIAVHRCDPKGGGI
jgi:hypothetical protein